MIFFGRKAYQEPRTFPVGFYVEDFDYDEPFPLPIGQAFGDPTPRFWRRRKKLPNKPAFGFARALEETKHEQKKLSR